MRWQDCSKLKTELHSIKDSKLDEKIEFLEKKYPTAAVYALKFIGRDAQMEKFMEDCKK